MQDPEVSKGIFLESRLDAYRSFFDHKWAEDVMQATAGSLFEAPAFNLCAAWRGVANTSAMPWIAFTMFKGFADGLAANHEPFGMKWVKETRNRLVRELRGEITHTKAKLLSNALERIFEELSVGLAQQPYSVDLSEIWSKLLARHELQMAIWGSQRLCYGALYYAYEDFIVQCVGAAKGDASFRVANAGETRKALDATLGASTTDFCWTDPDIEIARLTRNALVHSGGRLTPELSRVPHGFKVIDGELQITAPRTRSLHETLKSRVSRIVSVLVTGT
jgi:hypothetical protein